MKFARRLARFNRRVTNPLQRPLAARIPPWAVVVHHGRRTGREYRTPVAAFVTNGNVVVPLPYGDDTDWIRNLLAADGGSLVRAGRTLALHAPRVVDAADAPRPLPMRIAGLLVRRVLVAELG